MARKHNEDEVLKALNLKKDVKIFGSKIQILSDKVWNFKLQDYEPNPKKIHDLGNGSLGKISFLVNYCGYEVISVTNFINPF